MVEDCPAASRPTPQMYLADLPSTPVVVFVLCCVVFDCVVWVYMKRGEGTGTNAPASASCACASPISPQVQAPVAASRLRQARGLLLSTLAQAELFSFLMNGWLGLCGCVD